MLKGRVAALDPSIGLHLLGQEGRTLLAQYIGVKSQQRARRNVAYDCSKKGNVSMAIKIITAQTLMLKQQIKKAQDQIAHLDKLLTNPARPLSKTTEARYLTMLDDAEADLARLQRKQAEWQEVEEPQSIIPNFYYVLAHLPTEYKKLSVEGQKRMMRIVAKEVKLDMLSPHLFRLYIVWENGIAVRPDVALVWRGVTPNICEEWSEEEDNMMRRYYPERAQIELMRAFPRRAWYRICDRAQVLNLRRSLPHQGRARVNGYHRTMRYDDLEAVANLGESREEKERLCQIANELAQQTMRGSLTA